MKKTNKWFIFLIAPLLMANGIFYNAIADQDGHKEKNRHQKKERKYSEHNGVGNPTIANNPTYKENCGACHLAYPPDLLPAGSWDKILSGREDHFGQSIDVDPESEKNILAYLKANSAEQSKTERAVKIMRSLGNGTPTRITEVPLFQAKHRKIGQDIIKRESIGSLSNCSACHTTAESGIYDEHSVKIPK